MSLDLYLAYTVALPKAMGLPFIMHCFLRLPRPCGQAIAANVTQQAAQEAMRVDGEMYSQYGPGARTGERSFAARVVESRPIPIHTWLT